MKSTRRRLALFTALALVSGLALLLAIYVASRPSAQWKASAPVAGPELILIVEVDTLRRDSLGVYGGRRGLTPNMDRLAAQGVVFDAAFATSNHTYPSIASVMSGLYPTRHEFWGPTIRPVKLQPNLATVMPEGITTILVNGNPNTVSTYRDDFDASWAEYPSGQYEKSGYFPADYVFGQARALTEKHGWPERLLLYVQPVDPHTPYYPLKHYPDLFAGDPLAATVTGEAGTPLASLEWNDQLLKWSETELRNFRNRYDAEVRAVDEEFGRLLATLESRYPNRLILISADHGESFLDHQDAGHGTSLYDEQIRVPLIIADTQGRFGPPRREPVLVSNVDIMPSLAKAVGAPVPAGLDGVPIQTTLEQFSRVRPLRKRRTVVSEVLHSSTSIDFSRMEPGDPRLVLRSSPANVLIRATIEYSHTPLFGSTLLKYIRNESRDGTNALIRLARFAFQPHFQEMYDLDADPMERQSRMDVSRALAMQGRSPLKDRFPAGQLKETPLSRETLDRLRSLGYIK